MDRVSMCITLTAVEPATGVPCEESLYTTQDSKGLYGTQSRRIHLNFQEGFGPCRKEVNEGIWEVRAVARRQSRTDSTAKAFPCQYLSIDLVGY